MAGGKRSSTDEPLTEHDVAERLDKAVMRTLEILMDARQMGIMAEVKSSRYHTNAMELLAGEMERWLEAPTPTSGHEYGYILKSSRPKWIITSNVRLATHVRRRSGPWVVVDSDQATPADDATLPVETPLVELGLGVRPSNVLMREGVQTVEDLTARSADQLMAFRNFDVACLDDVRARLAQGGLKLQGDRNVTEAAGAAVHRG